MTCCTTASPHGSRRGCRRREGCGPCPQDQAARHSVEGASWQGIRSFRAAHLSANAVGRWLAASRSPNPPQKIEFCMLHGQGGHGKPTDNPVTAISRLPRPAHTAIFYKRAMGVTRAEGLCAVHPARQTCITRFFARQKAKRLQADPGNPSHPDQNSSQSGTRDPANAP